MNEIDKILSAKSNKLPPHQGRLLISEPFLRDLFFKRSVVLLADHDSDGSFGLILNKPVEFRLNEVIQNFPQFDVPVFMGGPLNTESIFFIHTYGESISQSYEILPGLYWGGDINDVRKLIELKQLPKDSIKFFLGYAGWGARQLEEELQHNSWIITDTRPSEIMLKSPANLWPSIVKSLGKEFEIWTRFPSDPQMN
ncbi:MAG: YqgE/AlgH family protein [Bacteroidota bacterium]